MNISDVIRENTVFFLQEKDKKGILDALITRAVEQGLVEDEAAFHSAIETRETIGSTAVGDGVAIPHASVSGLESCFVMTAVAQPPVDWDALDQKKVSLVFLIGVPTRRKSQYLDLLGQILKNVKNPEKKEKILKACNSDEIVGILTQ